MTVLLVSHDLNLAAELCDRLLLLAAAGAGDGTPGDVLEEGLLASVFGCAVSVEGTRPRAAVRVVQVAWPT